MNRLIAVIDDEPDILEIVSLHLKQEGFRVETFKDAKSFYGFIEKKVPDLLILDLLLPETSGFEVCKKLKSDDKSSHMPIIMLSAKDTETDKVVGLELGADDYLTKPFSGKELMARVKAVLRRFHSALNTKKIKLGDDLVIDPERFEVTLNGKKIDLTSTEFRILQILSSRKGVVFTREKILENLYGSEKIIVDRAIDVHINHLREKLGKASKYVQSVRGMGYKAQEE